MPIPEIIIAGGDYADQILFSSARFNSQVNGAPGDCYIRLRDPDRSLAFLTGASILLVIDGEAVWRGFITMWERKFVFPALDVDAFGETRFFDIIGTDINVLFTKRIIFNQATPALVEGKLYPPFTADETMIADLVTDYLDLSSDTIDTSTFVDNVGDSTIDQEGRAWSAGDTWGQGMQSIANLPAAIYYLKPTLTGADLVYCDVDTPDAPYGMSDQPSGGTSGTLSYLEDFARTVAVGWGTGAIGAWTKGSPVSSTASVSSGQGHLTTGTLGPNGIGRMTVPLPLASATAPAFHLRAAVIWPTATLTGAFGFRFDFISNPSFDFDITLSVGQSGDVEIDWVSPTDSGSDSGTAGFAASSGETWIIDVLWDGHDLSAKAWPNTQPEPAAQVSLNDVGFVPSDLTATPTLFIQVQNTTTVRTWHFDDILFEAVFPSTPSSVGYREMEVLLDGSGLVNDQLAWGMGYGSQTPVFVRNEDAASQALHGLWQAGKVAYGVYKQGTINRIAASIVDGSPQSKRGAKNDRVAVMCSTWQPGFLPSQKIDFTSEVWDFHDVIPVRKMEVTFEARDNPKYALTLSHEIDTPFGLIDPFFFNYTFPPFPPYPPFPTFTAPDGYCPVQVDDFERTVASPNWGSTTPIAYGSWAVSIAAGGTSDAFVDGDQGVIVGGHVVATGVNRSVTATLTGTFPGGFYPWSDGVFGVRVVIQLDNNSTGSPFINFVFGLTGGVSMSFQHGTGGIEFSIARGASEVTLFPALVWLNSNYIFEMEYDQPNGVHRGRIYQESGPVPDWEISRNSSGDSPTVSAGMRVEVVPASGSPGIPDTTYRIAEITYNACQGSAGTGSAPPAPSGYTCEVASRTDATTYQLTNSLVAGSSRVWVAGKFQRRDIEYTEDPTSGVLSFASSVSISDTVFSCYVTAGPLGDA